MILLVITLCTFAQGINLFTPPASSKDTVAAIDFHGEKIAGPFSEWFRECDGKNTCDGKPIRYGCHSDPNNNSALLRLKGGVIFFDAKMDVDADGSPYSKQTPGKTDQPETSLRYSIAGKPSINSDRVPYIVIPQGAFAGALGIELGDIAAVVYGKKRVFAVVADEGPQCKIGEGSIQLHEALGHSVCKQRAPNGDCVRIRDVGIERDVLYFIFAGTHKALLPGLKPENINARILAIGENAWRNLSGR
jgi:hypothetical protein